jgi:YggT family protein
MLIRLIVAAITGLEVLVFIRCILSWMRPGPGRNSFTDFVHAVTEPLMRPLRRVIPPWRGMDFSPILLFLVLELARRLVARA